MHYKFSDIVDIPTIQNLMESLWKTSGIPVGIVDIAVAIVIEGQHLVPLFLGLVFYEPPDEAFFRLQARRYGFDKETYLESLFHKPIAPDGGPKA